jgi:CBS domain-containing protein
MEKASAMQKVSEIMSRDVQVTNPDKTIQEAARQMQEGNFGMLPVESKGRLIGTISDRDIAIRAVAQGRDADTEVSEIMSKGIVTALEDDSVADAAKLMSENKIRRLPILNANKHLVGILALGDIAVVNADVPVAAAALSGISKPA